MTSRLRPDQRSFTISTTLFTCLCFLICCAWCEPVSAHGGTPRVLELSPPHASGEPFWVIDTLGLFKGQAEEMVSLSPLAPRQWSWLCDDAVDPTLGVDALVVLNADTLVAVARSGVYRSVDGGCDFDRVISPVNEHAIGALSVHPARTAELALFTDSFAQENYVWWSDDAGETWTRSDLTVEGSISALWRNPARPEELWVSHAEGLARSRDGGRTFERLAQTDYSMGVTPREVSLLGGGELGGRLHLWASLNRYPIASLLLSTDEGVTWREIHRLNDSYDQLVITEDALWVSSPFEGLFVYQVGEAERALSGDAWSGLWRQHPTIFVSCLTPDPLDSNAIWACGRSAPTDWIVARSDDLGESWSVLMESYQVAAEGTWGCDESSPSLAACSTRCLDAGCDPSQNISGGEVAGGEISGGAEMMMGMSSGEARSGAGSETSNTSGVQGDAERTSHPDSGGGCQASMLRSQRDLLFNLALWLTLSLLLIMIRRHISRPPHCVSHDPSHLSCRSDE